MKLNRKVIFTILSILFIFLSCNSTKKASTKEENVKIESPRITKGEYTIILINGLDELAKNPTMKIDFTTNKVSGNAGCNQYGGNFTTENNSIKFDRLMSTKMYCSKFQKIENSYLKMLARVTNYKLKDNQILFYDKTDTLMIMGKLIK